MIKKEKFFWLCTVFLICLYVVPSGRASTMYPTDTEPDVVDPGTADINNISLDYIYKSTSRDPGTGVISYDGINLLEFGPYSATDAVGVYDGNDDKEGVSYPNTNIGQYEDGLLNGEKISGQRILTGMEFIDENDLQDVDDNGHINDPGWIHLVNYELDEDDHSSTTIYDTFNKGNEGSLHLFDLLTFTINWEDEFTSGGWELALDKEKMKDLIALPDSGMFDHLAISLMAANGFAVYDFNFIKIFGEEADKGNNSLDFVTAYTLGGTFITEDFKNPVGNNNQAISHINIWARDPSSPPGSNVPEPATMLLFGLGLIGIAGVGRRKK